MVASINADQSEVTLISVPRDTVDVPLPDGTTWARRSTPSTPGEAWRHGRRHGGACCRSRSTATSQIDMGDLTEMVDAVGGVRVNPQAPLVDRHLGLRHAGRPPD